MAESGVGVATSQVRAVPGIVGVPAVVLLLGGGYLAVIGVLNVVSGASGGWVLWGAVTLAIGVPGVVAAVGLWRRRRPGWLLGLLVLPLMAVADVAFAVWQSDRVVLVIVAGVAWVILLLPTVRRAFS